MDAQRVAELEKMIKELGIESTPEELEESFRKAREKVSKYERAVVENLLPHESDIYEELVKAVGEGLYEDMKNDVYPLPKFHKYVPFKDGKGCVVVFNGTELQFCLTYPQRPSDVERLSVLHTDLSQDFAIYATQRGYEDRYTREQIEKRISGGGGYYCSFSLRPQYVAGLFVDGDVGTLKNRDRGILRRQSLVDFFEATGSQEGIDSLVAYRRHERSLPEFNGHYLERYKISELSDNIEQIVEITKNEDVYRDNGFEFNDCDNHVYYGGFKGLVDYVVISDQNCSFAVFFKDRENYVVFQLAEDMTHNLEDDEMQDIETYYFSGWEWYTNAATYHRRISLEYIDNFPIETIWGSDAFLFRVEDGLHRYGRGSLGSFAFDVVHTLNALLEEYGSYKKNNGYNGEPEILYGDMFGHGYCKTLSSIREFIMYTTGTGYEWHRDGYIVNTDNSYSVSLDEALALEIPVGDVDDVYGLDMDSVLLSFPDTITDAWVREVEASALLLVGVFERTGNQEEELNTLIRALSKRDKTREFISQVAQRLNKMSLL